MFELPPLPYDYDALEPHIDTETMRLHHDMHHATYVTKLNEALVNHPELQNKSLEELLVHTDELPEDIRQAVRNHGGGHHNHSLFWENLTPVNTSPSLSFERAIRAGFGSLESLVERMKADATALFGSGWVHIVLDGEDLKIVSKSNQDSPLYDGMVPLLGIDVWEHAYYLRYQNRRPEYLENVFQVVNWEKVSERFEENSLP